MGLPDPNPPPIGGGGGGGGGSSSGGSSSGGSSGGSSSSSSSGGSSAPPVDPRIAQLESLFRSAYIQLWGEPPTEEYVKQAAHSGMNVTEFVHRERMKDAFSQTKTYKDEFGGLLSVLFGIGLRSDKPDRRRGGGGKPHPGGGGRSPADQVSTNPPPRPGGNRG